MSEFVAFLPMSGAACNPQLDPWAQNFFAAVRYARQSTQLESSAFLSDLALEIQKRQY